MRRLLLLGLLCACGAKPVPDAGMMIDTSCGIDCAAQRRYGLIVGSCFEYTDTLTTITTPALAAEVMPVVMLEGGIPVLQVKYTSGGQRRQQDSFTIVEGNLKLVRREFGVGGTSVSYKTAAGALDGVKWLHTTTLAGENFTTGSNADVVTPGMRVQETANYRVTTSAGAPSELNVPAMTYAEGMKMLFSETPVDHGSDSRRVFVPDVGFVLIATPLMLAGGTSLEYRLQKVKSTLNGGSQCGG